MNWFAVMAVSLAVLAGCALVTVLKAFGFWRWAKYQWADAKAWMFDAEEDDAPWVEIPITFEAPKPKPKRKKRPKK